MTLRAIILGLIVVSGLAAVRYINDEYATYSFLTGHHPVV
jgi:hypothetical protein